MDHTSWTNLITLFDIQFHYFKNNIVHDIICFQGLEEGANKIRLHKNIFVPAEHCSIVKYCSNSKKYLLYFKGDAQGTLLYDLVSEIKFF